MQPSIKEAVLAWMRETGSSAAEAAEKFGTKANTIRQWQSRERKADGPVTGRDNTVTPPVTPRAKGTVPASSLTPDARAKLKAAINLQLDFLSDPKEKDQRARDAAARCLDNLLRSCPDILTFEERLDGRMGGAGTRGGASLTERLRAALGIAG